MRAYHDRTQLPVLILEQFAQITDAHIARPNHASPAGKPGNVLNSRAQSAVVGCHCISGLASTVNRIPDSDQGWE